MSEATTVYFVKQVWRQKGDALFEHIPFKEENKATDLSQTTRPVLVLETKSNGGSGTVFAIGRVTSAEVVENAIEYPNGEFLYHVPFAYDLILEDKKNGITREELQELTGQKFAPQVRGGLYEISEEHYNQVAALLQERTGITVQAKPAEAKPVAAKSESKAVAKPAAKSTDKSSAASASALADALGTAKAQLAQQPHLRAVLENGNVQTYPAVLLGEGDLVAVQETISTYIQAGGDATVDAAASEAAAAGANAARYANVIGLVERLVREGKYDSVQSPTLQKAFYRGDANLPHPYEAIELQGIHGHHILGLNGTLYTVEGKRVQHFLGL
ncbi:hypothetical protein [Tumebacillus flagellatus]|uniref:Uncharacterized protein n=1 Tax=Tumebacillus flagellatus TaxID=1157490 RepID=A0A074MHL5_9BACL|nr:hypothetical protein [Tumebacillus flagellatus]KEO85157.1 hypothetical protein EL26_00955 [Tumebacillus flagellatus]